MVPHKQINLRHIVLEALLNQQLFCGKSIAENVFGILKQMFMELLLKMTLDILFSLNVVIYYYMLHNLIMNGKDENINILMAQLEFEND
jgi:hypothetical protein